MVCDKIMGLRRLFIAKETDGTAGTFYELRASSVELPKIFAEQTIIDEASGYRADTAMVEGNLNELTGTITLTMTSSKADFLNFVPVQTLFYASGFNTASNSITPQNTGSCGNTFCIYTLDRTGQFAERMNHCIVTSIDFTFNRSDPPSVSFAFQAASKYEFWGNGASTAFTSDDGTVVVNYGGAGNFHCGVNAIDSLSAGEMPVTIGTEAAYISAFSKTDGITFTRPNPVEHESAVAVNPAVPSGAVTISSTPSYASNRAWGITGADGLKILSASVTIETGMSYGEMVVGHQYLSEVLVGGLNVTGSFNVYVDWGAGYHFNEVNGDAKSVAITVGDYKIVIPHLIYSEPPDLALAKNEPCTGDFSFKGFNGANSFDVVSLASV